eukprot:TRINITY_DN134_c0_g1_i1.p1 TRINITY_DN134_c0_g1~~TRINITY_DN134_c0_g1_i1.p1  ORF type:complete len:153 (-),score=50.50 TRINITY_DN134_c0_g1_i1:38-496(-)
MKGLLLIALLVFVSLCYAEDKVDLSKLKVKDLKQMLADRGVQCIGCSEKSHLIQKVEESLDLPIIERKEEKREPAAKNPEDKPLDTDEILKMFKNQEQEKKKNQEKLEELMRNNPQFAKAFSEAKMKENLKTEFSKKAKKTEADLKEEKIEL